MVFVSEFSGALLTKLLISVYPLRVAILFVVNLITIVASLSACVFSDSVRLQLARVLQRMTLNRLSIHRYLKVDGVAQAAARNRATDLARVNYFSHLQRQWGH